MWETHGSASTEPVIFCCGKTAAAFLLGVLQLFCCTAGHALILRAWIAPAVQPAAQLNIAYWHGKVIRSESGTTVHCCVSGNASVRKPAVPIGFITL